MKMTKYLIQDIVPPEKKKSHSTVHKKPVGEHAHHEAAHTKHSVKHRTHHTTHKVSEHEDDHELEDDEHKTEHEIDEVGGSPAPEEHTDEHDEHYEHEIHDDEHGHSALLIEDHDVKKEEIHKEEIHAEFDSPPRPPVDPIDPRSVLLEQLYKGNQVNQGSETKSEAAGEWPYNNADTKGGNDSHRPPARSLKTQNGGGFGNWIPWMAIPAVVIAGIVLTLNFFGGAEVSVVPKHDVIPIPDTQTFTAQKNSTDASLGYSVMKVTLTDSKEVPATGTKTVTAKASGSVVIYNEQLVAQRLIKNTRFQSAAGKIYRINDSVTVPKAATPKGGKLTPGSLKVTVYADEAGTEYNSDATDFTVPGLKDTPQAKKVYARSVGPISGGASGTIKSVSDQDLHQASDDLRVSLETKLRTKARGDLAPSQIAYDKGIVVDLEDPALSNDKASSDDKAVVTENGSLYMVVFDRPALVKSLAKTLIPTYTGENIEIKNLDGLNFLMPETKGDMLWNNSSLSFALKGVPELVWIVDQDAIKKDLVGIPKSAFNQTMAKYSTVLRAKASLRPFWKSAFPEDPKKITITVVPNIPD